MSRSNQLAGLLTADPPSALDTINEINTALGNDPNLATTLTNSIATKAPIASPTFTGTVSGVTKAHVGLGNVDNESKATMFASPTFTGDVTSSTFNTSSGLKVYYKDITTTNTANSADYWVKIGEIQGIAVTYMSHSVTVTVRDANGDDVVNGYVELFFRVAGSPSGHNPSVAYLRKNFSSSIAQSVMFLRKTGQSATTANATYECWFKYGQEWINNVSFEVRSTGYGSWSWNGVGTHQTSTPSGSASVSDSSYTDSGSNAYFSGNVGIGTASPGADVEIRGSGNTTLSSKGNLFVADGGTASQTAGEGGQITFGAWLNGDLSAPYRMASIKGVSESSTTNTNTGALIFGTSPLASGPVERMRISSGGNVIIGATAHINTSGGDVVKFYQNRNSSTPYWYFNTSGSYGVYSDERLKENITATEQADSVEFIQNLQAVEFNWKSNAGDTTRRISGLIAQNVLASAKTEGQKNILTNWETYDENDPDCPKMGLSDHRMIPSIVQALQVAMERIESQKSQIDALRSKLL